MAEERLDKLLASTGRWSRSEARRLIRDGRVLADGRAVTAAEQRFDPGRAALTVDGAAVAVSPGRRSLMLNKPAGVVCATRDARWRTVLDLIPAPERRDLFPAGRLDRDAEGLVLLTDDGALAHALLSPRRHVDKVYHVRVAGALTARDAEAFAAGLTLDGGVRCRAAALEILASGPESEALVTLREGKYHQIKRMFAATGQRVLSLKRLSIGPLRLDAALPPGAYRPLTAEEEETLRSFQPEVQVSVQPPIGRLN